MKPDHYTAHNNLGLAYHNRKMFKDAIESFNNALKIKPGFSLSYLGIGNTLREMGQLDAAVTSFQKAIAIDPTFSEAHNNLGLALMDLGLHESAISSYNTAKNQTPDSAEVRKNIGIINLLKGNFKIGWEEYSWRRFEKNTELTKRIYSQPLWNGEDLNGKTIFVYTEQGFGDTIQFVRYLDLLREQGGRVVLDAQLSLVPLLEEMESINVLLKENDLIPPFDFHVPLMELPRLFSTNAENIPAPNAYLMANEELVEAWKERLGPKKGYRVGIVWAGSPTHQDDYNRSMNLEYFEPLLNIEGCTFFSLQFGERCQDIISVGFEHVLKNLEQDLVGFTEPAAAITNMDLVISVDTAVVHLAGALGKPVWTLLQFNPDWRWMLDRNDSPWYSSMKLFRQEKRQDWQSVIERVTSDLRTLVK
jgi:tetratricopeptide (TPR) repeat protein